MQDKIWHKVISKHIEKDEEYFGQAFLDLKKIQEEDLAMGRIAKGILFEAACNGICLSKDWVYKYIIEMKIHGCTMLACIGEALFDIHDLEDILHDIPLWVEYFIMRKMDYKFPCGSSINGVYSSMYWMGRYITDMETKGCVSLAHNGKSSLCICRIFIDAYDIIILCEQ